MTNSLSCEREDDMIINKFPQKLNVNVILQTLQNMCSYALGNIYKHHFNKQKVTFDTLYLQHLATVKPTLIPSCLAEKARKIIYTKLQCCITKPPNKYFQTN